VKVLEEPLFQISNLLRCVLIELQRSVTKWYFDFICIDYITSNFLLLTDVFLLKNFNHYNFKYASKISFAELRYRKKFIVRNAELQFQKNLCCGVNCAIL